MKRTDAIPYVSFYLDDALAVRAAMTEPRIARTLRILNNSRLLAWTYGCRSAARFILKNLWR